MKIVAQALTVLILLWSFVSHLHGMPDGRDKETYYMTLAEGGRFDEALSLIDEKLSDENVDRALWLRRKGYTLAVKGNMQEAADAFEGAFHARQDPEVVPVLVWALLASGQIDKVDGVINKIKKFDHDTNVMLLSYCILRPSSSRGLFYKILNQLSVNDIVNDPAVLGCITLWKFYVENKLDYERLINGAQSRPAADHSFSQQSFSVLGIGVVQLFSWITMDGDRVYFGHELYLPRD